MIFNQALYDAHIDAMKAEERDDRGITLLELTARSFHQTERNALRLAAYKRKRAAYNCGAAIRNAWLKAVRAYKRKRLAL